MTARFAIVGVALGTLTACQHTEPAVQIERVEVPVPVPCVPADQIPDEPETVGDRLTGDASLDLPVIVASNLRLRAWGQEMRTALVACAG